MANILIVAALCIPFFSCGKAPEPQEKRLETREAPAVVAEPIRIEPNMHIEEPRQQIMMQRQEPVQDRVENKLVGYCERKLAEVERELEQIDGDSKYGRYLKIKKKALMERCIRKYK